MIKLLTNYSSEEKNRIKEIARDFSLRDKTAEIIYSRGYREDDEIERFLNPSKEHFIDPLLLDGMNDAVERIKNAAKNDETVVVYGDYDVDGVSATAILTLALKELGLTVVPFVPERADGYGLSVENIDKIFDEFFPDLVITVDCGISGAKEVEYIKDLGADVIVTDHHELPPELPDCTVVNCKIESKYGFQYLCGAGVAYKLAYALIGKKADAYLDFAAIATIADSMPLIGENRDIVFEGVKYIKSGKASVAVNALIKAAGVKEINSVSLAFSVAPRINAAGRMGNARLALELMLTSDSILADKYATKLNEFNGQRQQDCEVLYRSARQKLVESAFDKKIIVLEDDDWNGGLIGIIAARLVEEFSRPVILFVGNGESMHGSARSIESVNIYECISACREYLKDYGGHAQAAGITLEKKNFEAFKEKIEKYIDENYPSETFRSIKTADAELDEKATVGFAKELEKLEPFGVGNKRPLFLIQSDVTVTPVKPDSPHLIVKTDFIDATYFSSANKTEVMSSGAKKTLLVEISVSPFNGREYLKGYVKDVDFSVVADEKVVLEGFLQSLYTAKSNAKVSYASVSETEKCLLQAHNCGYGTIFAFYNALNVKKYSVLSTYNESVFTVNERSLKNNVLIAPLRTDIDGFKQVVYLDRPLGTPYITGFDGESVYSLDYAFDYSRLSCDKTIFGEIFKEAKLKEHSFYTSLIDLAEKGSFGYKKMQVVFALAVFEELGFLSFTKSGLKFDSSVKHSLTESKIYANVLKIKG